MASQTVVVRNKEYFVCEYTGALLTTHYFIPSGKNLTDRTGCYATLPVLLRAVLEEEGGKFSARFEKVKRDCEMFFTQPDIPIQPALPADSVPLGTDALCEYLEKMDLGLSWTLVPNGISSSDRKKKKSKTKK